MATLTSTAAASGVQPKTHHVGVQAVHVQYNSGATEISPSATTIFLAKIPTGVTIVDIVSKHSTGAATCPMDVGLDASLAELASAVTQGTTAQTKFDLPYKISVSGDATTRFRVLKGTVTPGTATASVKINMSILYIRD